MTASKASGLGCGTQLTPAIVHRVDGPEPQENARRRRRLVLLLTVAVIVAFAPALLGGFVSDDIDLIVQNPWAQNLHYLGRCFRTDLFDVPMRLSAENWVRFYRPLVTSSYLLNWVLSGGRAWTFHLVNVLFHLGAVLLAFRTARRWTGDDRLGALVALVFAIHPTRNESVIWISGRTDVFMTFFLLLALELIVATSQRTSRAWLMWAGGLLSFAAAILSKEYAVVLPLLLGVEVLLAPAGEQQKGVRKRLLVAAGISLAAVGLYLALRARYMPIRPPGFEASVGLGMRVTYVLLTVGRYLMRAVFPWPQVLEFRPIYVQNGRPVFPVLDVALGVFTVAAFLGLVVWLLRQRRRLDAIILCAAAIGFLPIANVSYSGFNSTTADRYFYFPLLLLCLALFRLVPRHWFERPWTKGRVVVAAGIALLCVGVDWVRALDFVSNRAFWQQEVAVYPDCPLGLGSLAEVERSDGNAEEAFAYMRRAYAPEARKYVLVAEPTRYYLYLLRMMALRLPDGDVRELAAIDEQLVALARGQLRRTDDVIEGVPLDAPTFDENVHVWIRSQHVLVAANAVGIASRLGRDDIVRQVAALVADDAPSGGGARFTLALALARADDYDGARHQLDMIRQSALGEVPEASLARLTGDIDKVQALREKAQSSTEPQASLLRAQADSTLAAWLRAARELRTAFQAFPQSEPVWSAYVKALVFCRLDDEADEVARARLDEEGARRLIGELKEQLTGSVARAKAVPKGTRWW